MRTQALPEPILRPLKHDLVEVLDELADIRKRKQLLRHPLYRTHHGEITRLLSDLEWDVRPERYRPADASKARPSNEIRAVAWNIERGKRFGGLSRLLTDDSTLSEADLFFLTEVDVGMGRSGNRNVARELADQLGTGYVFANHHLVLSPGDWNEQLHGEANTLAMHGSALLSRYPITRFVSVALPEYLDKFHHLEKRLGCKRALLAEVELSDGPLTVVVAHLDPFAPPRHRAWQMQIINGELARFGGERVLLGGDLNTTTYNLANGMSLFFDIMTKLATLGVEGVVREYLTPWTGREQAVFDELLAAGFQFEGFNESERGTLFCDTYDPELVHKAMDYLPKRVFDWLQRKLDPWDGLIPFRADWFAGRGLQALDAWTVQRPRVDGLEVSDHSPILLDFRLDTPTGLVDRVHPRRPRPARPYLRRHERLAMAARK